MQALCFVAHRLGDFIPGTCTLISSLMRAAWLPHRPQQCLVSWVHGPCWGHTAGLLRCAKGARAAAQLYALHLTLQACRPHCIGGQPSSIWDACYPDSCFTSGPSR